MPHIDLKQGTIDVRDTGSGPTVLFIHGLLVNGRLWRKVVPRLEAGHRCIVPDMPLGSHRRAMRPDADLTPPGVAQIIADLMEAMDLTDVTLVGNDTGGAMCQLVAARHPQRLGRLVLTPCDAYENFLPPLFRPLQWAARSPALLHAILRGTAFGPVRQLSFAPVAKNRDADLLREWLEPVRRDAGVRRDVTKVLQGIDPRHTIEAARLLRSFDKPTLLAWAPDDRFFKYEYAERLAAEMPDARIERIEHSRTFVSEDQPERTAELIAAFVAEHTRMTPEAVG